MARKKYDGAQPAPLGSTGRRVTKQSPPPESVATDEPGASAQPEPAPADDGPPKRRRAGLDPAVKKAMTAEVRAAKRKRRKEEREARKAAGETFEEGAPEWEPNEEELATVYALAGFGMSLEETAVVLGVSEPTILKHRAKIEEHRRKGAVIAKSRVRQSLYEQAVGGSLGHIRTYEEIVLGNVPRTRSELTGADGAPLPSAPAIGGTLILSDDELVARLRTLADRTASVVAIEETRTAPETPIAPAVEPL